MIETGNQSYINKKMGSFRLSKLVDFLPCHWISPFTLSILLFSRTFMAIIGGVIAGILGLTSLTGFIFYFLVMAITSVALTAKAKFSIHSYFDSWNRVLLDGFFGGLMVTSLHS